MEKPQKEPIVNYKELDVLVKQYMDYIDSDDYHEDNDYKHYIFEAAMEAHYGKDVWKWINQRRP